MHQLISDRKLQFEKSIRLTNKQFCQNRFSHDNFVILFLYSQPKYLQNFKDLLDKRST